MAMRRVDTDNVTHGVVANDIVQGLDVFGVLGMEMGLGLEVGKLIVPAMPYNDTSMIQG